MNTGRWPLFGLLMCGPFLGCSNTRVNVFPGFSLQPSDRVAFLDASERTSAAQGKSIANYLTNEFVGMVQVVERTLVEKVLEEKGLDPKTASQSELIAAIASSTNSNLVGIHVIEAFSETLLDAQQPGRGKRYRINGFLRIIDKEKNHVVISATSDYSANSSNEQTVLQHYAHEVFTAIDRKLSSLGKSSSPGAADKPRP